MIAGVPRTRIEWQGAVRIIRSLYPPIDLFEDIADPADWGLLLSAEQKTNPRLMESIGNLDLVPVARRVGGPGATWLMAPFTHVSRDRPSRFSDGSYGVLYAGESFRWLHRMLEPMERRGFGTLKGADGQELRFINGAIAYPGTLGPETIKAYLEDEYTSTLH